MAIPTKIKDAIDEAWEVVTQHPNHEYGPRQRRKLFELFKSDPEIFKVWRWLAWLSAHHVLPIYTAYASKLNQDDWYYDLKYPVRCLEMAEKILRGQQKPETGYEMANGGYEQSDFDCRLVLNPVPYNIYQASWGANIALLEVSVNDLDQFEYLSNLAYTSKYFIFGRDVGEYIKQERSDGVAGEDFTDLIWTDSGHSDTAAVASTAWACEESSKKIDSKKLLAFWRWWLMEAISEAWKLAEMQER